MLSRATTLAAVKGFGELELDVAQFGDDALGLVARRVRHRAAALDAEQDLRRFERAEVPPHRHIRDAELQCREMQIEPPALLEHVDDGSLPRMHDNPPMRVM